MNVSRLPFQRKAYDCIPLEDADCRKHRRWRDCLECMEHIKGTPQVENYEGLKYPDEDERSKIGRGIGRLKDEMNQLQDAIAEDLRGRLECFHNNPDVLLVCCGGIAQKFYRKIFNSEPFLTMPHPARHPRGEIKRGWLTLNSQERQCLQNIVDRLWPIQPGM